MKDIVMSDIKCVACGRIFKPIKIEDSLDYYFAFLKQEKFIFNKLECPNCGHETTDPNFNEDLESFIEQMEVKNAHTGIESLKKHNYSFSYLERALRIPYRTFSRWKANKHLSAVSKSYIDIIGNFPWIVDVADKDFLPEIKFKNLLLATLNEWKENPEFDITPVINKLKDSISNNLTKGKQAINPYAVWEDDTSKTMSQPALTLSNIEE